MSIKKSDIYVISIVRKMGKLLIKSKSEIKNEKLKLFYKDRLSAFKELTEQIAQIEHNIEETLNYKKLFAEKYTFEDLLNKALELLDKRQLNSNKIFDLFPIFPKSISIH